VSTIDTPATVTSAPAYPVPAPEGGDDPRFCFGLTYDIAKILAQYGYPPVLHGRDFFRLQQALFRFIYRQEEDL
jgi:hypothetical protein